MADGNAHLFPPAPFSCADWTPEAAALLSEYEADGPGGLEDFKAECTAVCVGCRTRHFGGYHCREIEMNDDGEFECRKCRSIPAERPMTEADMQREYGTWGRI
jgi:hypothetical protein